MDLRPASPMNRRTGTIDAILDSTGRKSCRAAACEHPRSSRVRLGGLRFTSMFPEYSPSHTRSPRSRLLARMMPASAARPSVTRYRVGQEESELLHGAPNEHHVDVGQRRHHPPQAVHRHHQRGESHQRQPGRPGVQAGQEREVQLRGEVGGEEPQRHACSGHQELDDLRVHPGQPRHPEPGEHDGKQHGGGADEPQHPRLHKVKGAAAPGPEAAPGLQAGDASDNEEERHDLQDPDHGFEPALVAEGVVGGHGAVRMEHGAHHHGVRHHHEGKAEEPGEVDHQVAVGPYRLSAPCPLPWNH